MKDLPIDVVFSPTQICEVKHHEVQDEQRDLIVNEIPVGKNDFPGKPSVEILYKSNSTNPPGRGHAAGNQRTVLERWIYGHRNKLRHGRLLASVWYAFTEAGPNVTMRSMVGGKRCGLVRVRGSTGVRFYTFMQRH